MYHPIIELKKMALVEIINWDYSAKANSAFIYYEFKSNTGLANSNSRVSIKET